MGVQHLQPLQYQFHGCDSLVNVTSSVSLSSSNCHEIQCLRADTMRRIWLVIWSQQRKLVRCISMCLSLEHILTFAILGIWCLWKYELTVTITMFSRIFVPQSSLPTSDPVSSWMSTSSWALSAKVQWPVIYKKLLTVEQLISFVPLAAFWKTWSLRLVQHLCWVLSKPDMLQLHLGSDIFCVCHFFKFRIV